MQLLLLIFCTLYCSVLCANGGWEAPPEAQEDEIHRLSSIPGPLFGFGQNIVNKDEFTLCSYFTTLSGLEYAYEEWDPRMIYGLSDRTALVAIFPVVHERINRISLSGAGNITLDVEHALYSNYTEDTHAQVTVLGAVLLPTAHAHHQATTDAWFVQPSTSFFIGTTARYITLKDYFYGAAGIFFSLPKNNITYGHSILYEVGFSKQLRWNHSSYLALLLEATGYYNSPDHSPFLPTKHGTNRLWLGPILHWVYNDWTAQVGFQYPIMQQNAPGQSRPSCRIAFQISFG